MVTKIGAYMKYNKLFFTIFLSCFLSISMFTESRAQTGTIIINNVTVPASSNAEFNFLLPSINFLTIHNPSSIAGVYEAGGAYFGALLDPTGITGNLELAVPIDGNTPLSNDLTDKIAVIDRGGAAFVTKVKNAQDAGAIAVIIINNLTGSGIFTMVGTDATITIPSIFISYEDGQSIKDELQSGEVNVTINGNGVGGSFSLAHGESQSFSNVVSGSYSISESVPFTLPPYGYLLDAINIDDPSGGSSFDLVTRTATINISDGETVEVTFINKPATLIPSIDTKLINTPTSVKLILVEDNFIGVGVPVEFEIIEGPNTGKSLIVNTDANGVAEFVYIGDGGVGTDIISANVLNLGTLFGEVNWITASDLLAELKTSVDGSDIHKETKRLLTGFLKSADKSLDRGREKLAILKLVAFKWLVKVQSPRKIDAALADEWIGKAEEIIDAIKTDAGLNKSAEYEELASEEILPETYNLNQNYPNPFNPTTTISYSIPSDGNVSLIIYDALGSEVAVLDNGFRTAGNYSHTFDASNLSSGMYFYTIRSGNFVQTKKMLLMK